MLCHGEMEAEQMCQMLGLAIRTVIHSEGILSFSAALWFLGRSRTRRHLAEHTIKFLLGAVSAVRAR